jgi:hypothetical protein
MPLSVTFPPIPFFKPSRHTAHLAARFPARVFVYVSKYPFKHDEAMARRIQLSVV